MYIYQTSDWPNFTWDSDIINPLLTSVRFEQGRLLGKMEQLGFQLQAQATLSTLTREIIKSSEIEGEKLDQEQVRSSIARHLGIDYANTLPTDRHIDGFVEVLLDATNYFSKPLSEQRLCAWHAALFPSGLSGMMLINPGMYRVDAEGPMQVVSGQYGRERVHYQAPAAKHLKHEMQQFINWFNNPPASLDPVLKAGIAHLWFVTLHPFDDGNGRMARVITDMALAQADQQTQRFYSMSSQIRQTRKHYYQVLERTQKSHCDITRWLAWFLQCLQHAIKHSDNSLKLILNKASFWKQHAGESLNQRQINMLNILFDGLKGHLTSSKWAKMMKCSQDTANRDINQLIEMHILIKSADGGRSTHYLLKDYEINYL